jgi:hypothetical protein
MPAPIWVLENWPDWLDSVIVTAISGKGSGDGKLTDFQLLSSTPPIKA